jgi:hypothetical protein
MTDLLPEGILAINIAINIASTSLAGDIVEVAKSSLLIKFKRD